MERTGGGMVSVDGRQLWPDSAVILGRIGYEKERRKWRSDNGYTPIESVSWGSAIREATITQVARNEMDTLDIKDIRPCRMHLGGAGI